MSDHFKRTGFNFGVCTHCGHRVKWNALAMGGHINRNKKCIALREVKRLACVRIVIDCEKGEGL